MTISSQVNRGVSLFFLLSLTLLALQSIFDWGLLQNYQLLSVIITVTSGLVTLWFNRNEMNLQGQEEPDAETKNYEGRGKSPIKIIHLLQNHGIWLILCFALLLNLVLTFTYVGNDEASYVYDAKLILEGKAPYTDFVTRASPQIYLYAFFMKFLGVNLYVPKIINVLINVGTVYVIYLIGKLLLNKKTGIVAAVFYLISPITMLGQIPTSTTILNALLVSLGMYFFGKGAAQNSSRDLFFSGFFFSLGYLTRFLAAFYLPLLAFMLLFKGRRDELGASMRRLLCLTLGFLLPIMVFTVYSIFYLDLTITLNILGIGIIIAKEAHLAASASVWNLKMGTIFSIHLLILTVLFFVCIIRNYFSNGRKLPADIITAVSLFLVWLSPTALLYLWYAFKRGFFFTYFFDLMPPLCLLSALFLIKFNTFPRETLQGNLFKKTFNTGLILLVSISLFSVSVRPFSEPGKSYSFRDFLGSGVSFETVTKVSNYIKAHTAPEDEILAGSLQWSVQAKRRQMLDISHPLIYEKPATIYKQYPTYTPEDLINYFQSHNVEYVIFDAHFDLGFWYLDSIINSNYKIVEDIDGIKIYQKISEQPRLEKAP